MKRKSFLTILLFVAITQPCQAQVNEVIIPPAQETIIRSYTRDINLIYFQQAGNPCYFCLSNDHTVIKYFTLYSSITINDIEVRGDTAFFCGSGFFSSGPSQGLYGFFCISDVFYNSGIINMYRCASTPILPISFSKLDVFYIGEQPNLALIGKAILPTGDTVSTVASMHNIGAPVSFNYVSHNLTNYTDICCLEDMIVAVGQSSPYSDCITKAYHIGSDFVLMPYSTTSAYSISNNECSYSGGPYLIKHAFNNYAAIAFHTLRNASTMIYKLHFNAYTGMPSAYLPVARTTVPWVDPYNPLTWRLYEMSYNPTTSTMYLLENGRHLPTGTFQRWLLPFSMTTTESSINGIQLLYGSQQSLDMSSGTIYPITSGIYSTHPCYYYRIDNISNNCKQIINIPTESTNNRINEVTFQYVTTQTAVVYFSPYINIFTTSHSTECE